MIFVRFLLIFVCNFSMVFAESEEYETMNNKGLNKSEKLEKVDHVLLQMNSEFKSFDSKINDQAVRIKKIEESISDLNREIKKVVEQNNKNSEVASQKKNLDLDKIRNDLESLKKEDISKLKFDLESLTEKVNNLYYKNKK